MYFWSFQWIFTNPKYTNSSPPNNLKGYNTAVFYASKNLWRFHGTILWHQNDHRKFFSLLDDYRNCLFDDTEIALWLPNLQSKHLWLFLIGLFLFLLEIFATFFCVTAISVVIMTVFQILHALRKWEKVRPSGG